MSVFMQGLKLRAGIVGIERGIEKILNFDFLLLQRTPGGGAGVFSQGLFASSRLSIR